ncbi:hypothetical protein D3H55_10610 [Bacillus salacetis]|uniref:DUF4830 domain-containing protein n=1 Tax=Bacillus salacetis TaxID=2315464 RepID=A0A3A1QZ21_9BACI|nr:hypothetical protein [Bacillus salacetis]RIW34039.1 hypothetical protein D3H55_10610 [Bacillus salacetis]
MKRLIFFTVIFFPVGCGPQMDSDGELAKQYLLDQGYDIESYEGNKDYSFTRAELGDIPHNSMWSVQPVSPEPYIGKEIAQEAFVVKNHPLSEIYGHQEGFTEKVEVRVFISNGEVIGGISNPVGEGIGGCCYSLDGKTAEEIHGDDLVPLLKKWKDQN